MPKRLVLHNSMVQCVQIHGNGKGFRKGSVHLSCLLIFLSFALPCLLCVQIHGNGALGTVLVRLVCLLRCLVFLVDYSTFRAFSLFIWDFGGSCLVWCILSYYHTVLACVALLHLHGSFRR